MSEANAVNLYNSLVQSFQVKNIKYKENRIGFSADSPSVMIVSAIRLICVHHMPVPNFHANQKIWFTIFSTRYFHSSCKLIESFREFQSFANVKPHKMLHLSQTRWLSFQLVVSRVLEQ
ncbi:hypothetical protein PR048_013666 [Dryococelus australis]|uniref:Uncharacterized protein n=1 Tax=Dryococelus australis TaxID=614101 RepID=A0ABQ9HTM9_9NEOP|nr:hypothetical protein PR048_013666 [Dryococelus australis]